MRLLGPALVLYLVSTVWAAPCHNATASLCWFKETIDEVEYTMLKSVGTLGAGESGPIKTSIVFSEGGKKRGGSAQAAGTGKTVEVTTVAPTNDNTEVTVYVKGGDCGPTEKKKKKRKDIPKCE